MVSERLGYEVVARSPSWLLVVAHFNNYRLIYIARGITKEIATSLKLEPEKKCIQMVDK